MVDDGEQHQEDDSEDVGDDPSDPNYKDKFLKINFNCLLTRLLTSSNHSRSIHKSNLLKSNLRD